MRPQETPGEGSVRGCLDRKDWRGVPATAQGQGIQFTVYIWEMGSDCTLNGGPNHPCPWISDVGKDNLRQ
ncbi:hypothetical protein SAMN02746041_02752 [Desulfacinum hydrothermale DSM 13146]|uniref:Uncharacterized protein n=1 Tax=Desulfacinum hydrothermale DSM 13146 TaxID=1121390 RepID=A0A1W1XT87_9BACT|nr:hypothetical protein SAMN02746041_02752 [Desulfacinum hydrothermale DSM 13146]